MGKRIFNILIPHHISSQIGLIFGLVIIISLGFLGISLINTSRQAVVDSVLRDYENIAGRAGRELNNSIELPRELLVNTAAIMGNLPPTENETKKLLIYQLFTDHSRMFERMALTDRQGKELLSSDWGRPLEDRSATEVFQTVNAVKQPVFSRVYFSPEHIPYVTIAVPVKKLDEITGFLMAEVKLSGFWEVVDSIKLKDGEAFIVDDAGYILVHKEERRVYRGENLYSSRPVQSVLAGKSGSEEETIWSVKDGKEYLCAYAPIRPFDWGLIIRQPLATAYAFSLRMQSTAAVIILLAILGAILVSLLLARWIVRPIETLVRLTDEVATGNLEKQIITYRNDEVGKLLRSFNAMVRRLKEARRMEKLSNIGLATSKIGHELRNPLVSIKTFIHLLPRKYRDEDFINNLNNLLPVEISRLEKMVQELSEFSSVPGLRLAECHLDKVINHTVALFDEQFKQQNIRVITRLGTDHSPIMADSDRLSQVLINLVHNALAAMPSGGQLEINSRWDEPGKAVRVEVRDSGCGIAPEELPDIFEPFHTFKKGGLGLGLTICKEIIEQHRGRIEVTSEVSKGTTFTVKLPVS